MRILITGALGRLGGSLKALLQSEHEVTGVDVPDFDIADWAATRAYVKQVKPDLVLHPAAWTDVDGCARDPERAVLINGSGAQHIALAAAEVGAPILYVSSNEVFDGKTAQPYREYDVTHPINPYGYSKWVGEQAVMRANPRHYIVRTAWLFAHGGKNFIQAILNAARAGKPLRVVTDEVANPTYTDDVADAIVRLIKTERFGIYHFVNEGYCSRYDFARFILDQTGYSDTPIERIIHSQWPRPSSPPLFAPMHNHSGRIVGIELRPWQTAVQAFMAAENGMESRS